MRYLTILLLLGLTALGGCDRDPVERELVGSWQTAITSPAGAWQLRFTTLSNGQYRTDFQGPFAVPAETGYFTAAGGEWRLEKIAGSIEEGTYEFLTDDSVLFQSTAGAVVWNRIPTGANALNPTAVATPEAFAPSPAQSAAAMPATNLTAAISPNAHLLSTGPFGAALQQPEAAVGAIPQGFGAAPSGAGGPSFPSPGFAPQTGLSAPPAPFGAPKPTPSDVFSPPGAASTPPPSFSFQEQPPQDISGAVGGLEQQLQSNVRTLTDVPEQALADIEGAAQQAAADAIGEATAPVTEAADEATRKVGGRIQTFTGNAASRVRNFFSGRRRKDRDQGEQATDEER